MFNKIQRDNYLNSEQAESIRTKVAQLNPNELKVQIKALDQLQRHIVLQAMQRSEGKKSSEPNPIASKVIEILKSPSSESDSSMNPLLKVIRAFFKGLANLLGLRISSSQVLNAAKKMEPVLEEIEKEPTEAEVATAKKMLLRDLYQKIIDQQGKGVRNAKIVTEVLAWAKQWEQKYDLNTEVDQLLKLLLDEPDDLIVQGLSNRCRELEESLVEKTPPHGNVFGKGEVSSQVRVSYINGIKTSVEGMQRALQAISSSHGDVNVHYIFSPSAGVPRDIYKAALNLGGIDTSEVDQLVTLWRRLFNEMGGISNPNNRIVHYGYSRGGAITKCALAKLTPEEREHIRVRTIGSPTSIGRKQAPHVKNIVSRLDKIPMIDSITLAKNYSAGKVEIVTGPSRSRFFEHSILGEIYQLQLKKLGGKFISKYGSIGR